MQIYLQPQKSEIMGRPQKLIIEIKTYNNYKLVYFVIYKTF